MTSFIDAIINRIKGPEGNMLGAGPQGGHHHPRQHGHPHGHHQEAQHHPETPLSQQRRMPSHVPSSVPPPFSARTAGTGARVSSLPMNTPASPPLRTPLEPYTPAGKNGVVFVPRRLDIDATPDLVSEAEYASVSAKIPLATEDRSVSISHSTRRSSMYHTADAGEEGDTSHSSVEISVGPQSVPFAMARRRDPLDRIHEHATSDDEAVYTTAMTARMGQHGTATSAQGSQGAEDAPLPVSSWRKEQLKYQKKARLCTETGPRPISAYHGPLSLPYARNPSGVDATISDDSAYLSNVFGLKAAPTIIPSGGTNRTVSTTSNSTTTSSIDFKRQMSTFRERANNALARAAMYQTTGQILDPASLASGQAHLIREPHQQIGIRKNSIDQGVVPKPGLKPTGLVYVPQQAGTTVTIRAPDGTKPSATLRSQLNARTSDLESINEPLNDPAIVTKRVSRAPEFNGVTYPLIPYGPDGQLTQHQEIQLRAAAAANSGTWPVLPPFSHIRVDSFGGIPRLVSDSSNSDSLTGPGTARSSSLKSKADTSANWRNRTAGEESHIDGLKPAQDKGVMTVESLFERFGHLQTREPAATPSQSNVVEQVVPAPAVEPPTIVSAAAPAPPAITATVTPLSDKTHIVNTPALGPIETPSKVPRAPVTVKSAAPASTTTSAASSTKSPSRLAKGTPGAGKHLKKPSSSTGTKRPPVPKVSETAKTAPAKGKDRAALSAKH